LGCVGGKKTRPDGKAVSEKKENQENPSLRTLPHSGGRRGRFRTIFLERLGRVFKEERGRTVLPVRVEGMESLAGERLARFAIKQLKKRHFLLEAIWDILFFKKWGITRREVLRGIIEQAGESCAPCGSGEVCSLGGQPSECVEREGSLRGVGKSHLKIEEC